MHIPNHLAPWINKTAKMIQGFVNQTLKDNGIPLTTHQMVLLKVLSLNDGLPQNQLAFLTERDKTSLTRLVNTMEKKNYIARIPDKTDKRINLLHITKTGLSLIKEIEPEHETILKMMEEGITREEIQTTMRVLEKVQNNICNIDNCNCNQFEK